MHGIMFSVYATVNSSVVWLVNNQGNLMPCITGGPFVSDQQNERVGKKIIKSMG